MHTFLWALAWMAITFVVVAGIWLLILFASARRAEADRKADLKRREASR